MLRDFIDFPGKFASSLDPILGVVAGLATIAVAGVMLVGVLAVMTPHPQPVR